MMNKEEIYSERYWLNSEVYNPYFGKGIVVGFRQRYKEAQVAFEDITIWMNIEELTKIKKVEPQKKKDKAASKYTLSRKKAKKIVEALRLGVVPEAEIEEYTVHRAEEIKEIEKGFERAENEGGNSTIILGEYGSGKSHFLDLIRSIALKKGFVVAKAEMDAYEIRPHRPKRLYRALMENIKWQLNSSDTRLRDFIQFASEKSDILSIMKDHKFFYPLLKLVQQSRSSINDLLWEWAEGNEIRLDYLRKNIRCYTINSLPALYDSGYAADLYCYILTGLSYMAKSIGFKGLVLLIDEGESIYMVNRYENEKANNFIKGLILASSGNFKDSDLLFHSYKRRTYPYSYREKSFLYTIFAMTPRIEDIDPPAWLSAASIIELSPLDINDMQTLYNRLIEIYKRAYSSFDLNNSEDILPILYELWEGFSKDFIKFRQCLKGLVEVLDIKRHYPLAKILLGKDSLKEMFNN